MYTISPVHACLVLRDLLRRGYALAPLFAGTSLDRRTLESGGNIAVGDFLKILENARSYTGDETLGLMIGRYTNVAALGPIAGAAATTPTVRDGLQVLENFSRLHATYIRVELVSGLHFLSVRFRYLIPLGEVERFHSETAVLFVQNYVEMLTGGRLDDARYRLSFKNPGYAAAYARYMHSPPDFGHAVTSVDLPHHWLDLQSPYYNTAMWNQAQLQLARHMKEQSTEVAGTYTQHVTALLRSFEPPLPDLHTVVEKLHLSQRTLNRRLQQEGSSFRNIRAEVLQRWACQYLAETDLTVEAIAVILGYQDTANFRRAFRVRQQCSPGEYRRSLSRFD